MSKPPSHDIHTDKWLLWTQKRRTTFIGFIIVGSLYGIDVNIMYVTLYLYLKKMIQVEHPRLWYGIIIAARSISSILFGIIFGRWVDKTRKMRAYVFIMLILQIIGCVIYIVPFNVVFPLVGQFLAGVGNTFAGVALGEVMRIYDKREGIRALWWMASYYWIGALFGPLFISIFQNVDFYVWHIHITKYNGIFILEGSLQLLTIPTAYFLIHDCSSEMDVKGKLQGNISTEKKKEDKSTGEMKDDMDENNEEDMLEKSKLLITEEDSDTKFTSFPIKTIVRMLYKDTDAVLMFVSTFFFSYCLFFTDILQPLLIVELLQWTPKILAIVLAGEGFIYFLFQIFSSKYITEDRDVYAITVLCIASHTIMFSALVAIKSCSRDMTRDIVFITLFAVSRMFSWLLEDVTIKCMLARMVPSHSNSFVEGLRNGVSKGSRIFASISAPLALPFLHIWSYVLLALAVVILVCFFKRKKTLCDIEEIDFYM